MIEFLEDKIAILKKKFDAEIAMTNKMFNEAEVSKLVSKALYKFELSQEYSLTQGNQKDTQDLESISKYKKLYTDLLKQTDFEKKLDNRTIESLENKVSELLAENGQLKN